MYGETRGVLLILFRFLGLSPHVRGNRDGVNGAVARRGSIPACTGKPGRVHYQRQLRWVYPRMYGETRACSLSTTATMGLSPHVRGNRDSIIPVRARERSIPACTGKPPRSWHGSDSPEVYPRMYGETVDSTSKMNSSAGLSPHVRGNRGEIHAELSLSRSIPACTGKPGLHG